MENRIDAVLTAQDGTDILRLVQDIRVKLPFLIDLSNDEIKTLPKMGDKSRAFVAQALTLAEQNDAFLPRSFDVAEMRKDVELTDALLPVLTAVASLKELLEDTYMLAGSEAYAAALVVYGSAQTYGGGSALDESLDALGQRFARKTKGKNTGNLPNT